MRLASRLTTLAALVAFSSAPLAAQNIVVGTSDPNAGNCYPFICFAGDEGTRWQQIYDASAFGTHAISITDIFFFATNGNVVPGTSFDGSSYSVSLSTVSETVAGLSTGVGPIAVGGNNQAIFTGVVGGLIGSPTAYQFSFAPFTYDPSLGNLLLTVDVLSAVPQGYVSYLDADNSCQLSSRAFANPDFSGGDCTALVTGFNATSVVPEPSSVVLVAAGLLGVVTAARRRKRA